MQVYVASCKICALLTKNKTPSGHWTGDGSTISEVLIVCTTEGKLGGRTLQDECAAFGKNMLRRNCWCDRPNMFTPLKHATTCPFWRAHKQPLSIYTFQLKGVLIQQQQICILASSNLHTLHLGPHVHLTVISWLQ